MEEFRITLSWNYIICFLEFPICIFGYMYMCVCVYIYIYIYVYIYIYIYCIKDHSSAVSSHRLQLTAADKGQTRRRGREKTGEQGYTLAISCLYPASLWTGCYIHIHVRIYIYIHTSADTYIHTYTRRSEPDFWHVISASHSSLLLWNIPRHTLHAGKHLSTPPWEVVPEGIHGRTLPEQGRTKRVGHL
jgi:hypothetical protein